MHWLLLLLFALIATFWLTHGFENLLTARPYSVTGVWDYTMRSNLDQRIHSGSIDLTMDGETVSGTMRMWDKTDSAVKHVQGRQFELCEGDRHAGNRPVF